MDTDRLTDQEYEAVARWRQLMETPNVWGRMWAEGYRNLFNPDRFVPIQIIKFYAIIDRKIVEYNIKCEVLTTPFNEFKNTIINECRHNNMELIGPYVPKDSSIKELVDIIKFYEDRHYIKFSEFSGFPPKHQDDNPTDKPTNQNGDAVSNLI